MKKSKRILGVGLGFVLLVCLIVALLINNINIVSAAGINPGNPEDPLGVGLNPENIPQTPDELANASSSYLKKEWNAIILKTPYIRTIHNWALNNQIVFRVLFNEKYDFSLTFICIFILWWIFVFWAYKLINAKFNLGLLGFLISLGVVVILSQINVIGGIVRATLKIISTPSYWWARDLLWLAVILILFLLSYLSATYGDYLQKLKEEKEKKETQNKAKKAEAFIEGAEEGQEMAKGFWNFSRERLGLK
jgi:ABC-type multidrug transport system fused ATPase/permease subunit